MKKIISITLVCLMLLMLIIPSFADDKSMTISTSRDEDAFELTYPIDTKIPWQSDEFLIGSVKATVLSLSNDKCVSVAVSSQNDLNLIHKTDLKSKIQYSLVGSENILFLPGDYEKEFPLTVKISKSEWNKANSGEYNDVLTFTANYKDM